jgi:hypothetical protein
MKSIVFFLLMVLTFPVFAQELVRLGLDDLQSVSPKIESVSVIKVEGQSSVKITVQWPVTICLGEIEDLKVENARLIYKARVKTELDGLAYLEMWAHLGDKKFFSRGLDNSIEKTTDWQALQAPFVFEKEQNPDKVTLNLVINGSGTVWIDDILLLAEPLK